MFNTQMTCGSSGYKQTPLAKFTHDMAIMRLKADSIS